MEPNIQEVGVGGMLAIGLTDANAGLITTGRIFIVNGSSEANANEIRALYGNGYPDGTPMIFTTLTLALAKCVAGRGDIVYIAPGHTETVVGAAGINVNVADVRIIGIGSGVSRPTFTFTTSVAASFDINAANVVVKNLVFVCGIDAQTAMNNVAATDVSFQNCEWRTNSGTVGAILGILTAATSDRLIVNNSRFLGPATNTGTTTTAQIQYEAAVDIQITGCYFTGKMTQAILNVTGTVLRGLIATNNFVIATGTKAISVAAASTPFISGNKINVPSGTAPVIAAAGFVAGNAYSAAAGVTAGTASTF